MTELEIRKNLISEFCDLVLVDDDALEFDESAENFVKKWVGIWKLDKSPDKSTRDILNDLLKFKFHNYEMLCQKSAPYSFLSSLQSFQTDFYSSWKKKTNCLLSQKTINAFVSEINDAIKHIKERSDHFDAIKIYLKLKDRDNADPLSEKVSNLFQKVADAEDRINKVVKNASNLASKKTTETSVTILGMFSGIVLTVVAGLFYSASVINNINTADFYRLISTAALVGVVCFDLLALMFHYIERIRSDGQTKASCFTLVIVLVNIVLIVIMWHYSTLVKDDYSNSVLSDAEKSVFDVNISMSKKETTDQPREIIQESEVPSQQETPKDDNTATHNEDLSSKTEELTFPT